VSPSSSQEEITATQEVETGPCPLGRPLAIFLFFPEFYLEFFQFFIEFFLKFFLELYLEFFQFFIEFFLKFFLEFFLEFFLKFVILLNCCGSQSCDRSEAKDGDIEMVPVPEEENETAPFLKHRYASIVPE
jgi:hypothetical protein